MGLIAAWRRLNISLAIDYIEAEAFELSIIEVVNVVQLLQAEQS